MPYYRPTLGRNPTDAEKALINSGYPHVGTNTLNPGGRLQTHAHSSQNTHLVVSGQLTIGTSRTRESGHATCTSASGQYQMAANTQYQGHRLLSPTTAERFFDGGSLQKARKAKAVDGQGKVREGFFEVGK